MIAHNGKHRAERGNGSRDGMILMIAIVCVAVASMVFMAVLKTAVTERSAIEARHWQEQARWLAESGVERAAARLAADPAYRGETWRIPAEEIDGNDAGVVKVEVSEEQEGENGKGEEGEKEKESQAVSDSHSSPLISRHFSVRVQADFPDDPHHRARYTKQVPMEIGSSE